MCALNLSHRDDFSGNNNNYFGGEAGHFFWGGKLLHLKYPKLYGNLSCSFES